MCASAGALVVEGVGAAGSGGGGNVSSGEGAPTANKRLLTGVVIGWSTWQPGDALE